MAHVPVTVARPSPARDGCAIIQWQKDNIVTCCRHLERLGGEWVSAMINRVISDGNCATSLEAMVKLIDQMPIQCPGLDQCFGIHVLHVMEQWQDQGVDAF